MLAAGQRHELDAREPAPVGVEREARDRAELMLKEVNHRVSNSLSMIAAFARLQAGVVEDPAARQALGDPRTPPAQTKYDVPKRVNQMRHVEGTPLGTRGGLMTRYTFPVDAEYEIQIRLARDRNEQERDQGPAQQGAELFVPAHELLR